ncbi:MAG TPA: 50S ribosomal protein L18 [Candidatus Paceibacterota bacterium]|nr:50S ribosomal protein L18 [Candidatus Paceibacterota bacterium]HMP19183.1 50S ribosomal protein L18 [Candidatus Paceibacterota bacterium]HMP85286.1 50S ribosomal protein L18 [Candidatus Paceibacterota bacterium]
MSNTKLQKRIRRHSKIRAKISGTEQKPRFSVSKSNTNIIAQIINDEKGETIVYVWTKNVEGKNLKEKSINAGKKIAELAKDKKIKKVVFDRGGFLYAGNIKALADSARQSGLEF